MEWIEYVWSNKFCILESVFQYEYLYWFNFLVFSILSKSVSLTTDL